MRLDAAQQQKLAPLIASVPLDVLSKIVSQHGLVIDLQEIVENGPSDPEARRLAVATAVVDCYSQIDAVERLLRTLAREMRFDDSVVGGILPLVAPERGDSAKQAALVIRANTLRSRQLREFLARLENQVCVIVSEIGTAGRCAFELGTGFLVGPDLVLTAYHTLKPHIADGARRPGSEAKLCAFFDFCEGDPIDDPRRDGIAARRVAFAREWLVEASEDLANDGRMSASGEAAAAAAAQKSLDFVLVRLAERIGHQTAQGNGGVRRGWINPRLWGGTLRQDDRIIISQHPHGHAQRIDFGRFSEPHTKSDRSETRLRYSTETDDGTSGAPCFNQNFHLVGMHNAVFMPGGKKCANQAIRIEAILAAAKNWPALPKAAPRLALWSTTTATQAPVAILHRESFLEWLERAACEPVLGGKKDRLYGAVGASKKCGKTFSIDILRAFRTATADRIAVLGAPKEDIPQSAADLVACIADALGMPKATLADMPPRPSGSLPAGSKDGDKLRKWASEEVPSWFAGVLGNYRRQQVDLRIEARAQRDALKAAEVDVPAAISNLADATEPVFDDRLRWSIGWIVLDRLDQLSLSAEVSDLVAGLSGANLEEESVHPELGRLRWLFLGRIPEFTVAGQITADELDARNVSADDVICCMRAFAESRNAAIEEECLALVRTVVQTWEKDDDIRPKVEDPERRIKAFQDFFRSWAAFAEKAMKENP